MFRVYPAVDIKGGKCVRLYQGEMRRETVFSSRPWEMALLWESQGASYLHVVDLDGAVAESLANLDSVKEILDRVHIPVQVGGGVRSEGDIRKLLSLGAQRVVLGTRALTESAFLKKAIDKFGSQVIVSVDTRNGEIAVRGWTKETGRSLEEVVEHLISSGAARMIHTDITRDGTLQGYDQSVLEPLLDKGIGIIAAGGISTIEDVAKLKALTPRGLEGAIIGRALYSGDITLSEVLKLEEE
jgi:phosphoribosylformimino-5-aminoimidazole carboxamide ribotide isomerase